MSFNTVVTQAGLAKDAAAIASGTPISLLQMAFGDGNGNFVTVNSGMTALVHEVYRVGLDSVVRDSVNTNWVKCTATVPAASGPFTIREVGVFCTDGTLWGVANYPDTYKPAPSEGTVTDITVTVIFVVTDSSTIQIDLTSTTGATQTFVEDYVQNYYFPVNQHLQVPFISVASVSTLAPPTVPAFGDLYGVPTGATGFWAGKDGMLAQFVGSPTRVDGTNQPSYVVGDGGHWVYRTVPSRTIVGARDDGLYYEKRSTANGGPWRLMWATDQECIDGVLTDKWVSPHGLLAAIKKVTVLRNKAEQYNPVHANILTPTNKFNITQSGGVVTLGSGQSWVHRGVQDYSTDLFVSSGQNAFTPAAGKTYHGRIRHVADGVPTMVWQDTADTTYNASALAESATRFDGTYDDILFATVSKSSGGVITITPLLNVPSLTMPAQRLAIAYIGNFATVGTDSFTFNFARCPAMDLQTFYAAATSIAADTCEWSLTATPTRYGASVSGYISSSFCGDGGIGVAGNYMPAYTYNVVI